MHDAHSPNRRLHRLDPAITRDLLQRYVTDQGRRADAAESVGDVETWEVACDAEQDGLTAIYMVDAGLW